MNQVKRTKSSSSTDTELEADVLVIGGGPAGTWAALEAVRNGATNVVLAEKGYCGSSGATAAAGTTVWYISPDEGKRETAMDSRYDMGGRLADYRWMERVLDRTWHGMNELADHGYPFPLDATGRSQRVSLQGPEYMRLMRKRVVQAGVKILDQSPALELLQADDGSVAGARGVHRQNGSQWRVRSKAVVIATGGCAFLSRALGCNVLTGDGLLMSAEVGAEMSGMEFSNAYAIAPESGSVTKTMFYNWASFTDEAGEVIPGAASKGGRSVIARELNRQKVYARLDKADEATRLAMRASQPNFFLPFDRQGIDPFTQRFSVTLRLEGTVRGTGGLRITSEDCATSVSGLYAAGDAATREPICGGFTGGGSHNAAWAISSGSWAGQGAARFALQRGTNQRAVRGAGVAAISGAGRQTINPAALTQAVQDEVFPFDRNYFRHADVLAPSLGRLDDAWLGVRESAPAAVEQMLAAREAAAMLATARWMYASALARKESRGMHKRYDHLQLDPTQHHHIVSGGLDQVWARPLAYDTQGGPRSAQARAEQEGIAA
ncbi:FAD-dependent oxidoreductase [Cupriavidus metallidurans]|uniref:FAD-dependent oxidoreductase n=1 Tax=Cupriavidus metallidurans TaxID=119219 RepID=UPI001CCA1E6C|nr:FAD-binding protein [Cupriavidus metallidurans]UBM07669.1 FAD-binding protein [Cupriavidus metallidurans]